jgi:hypothetical protein
MFIIVDFSMAACRLIKQNSGVIHAGIRLCSHCVGKLWVKCTYLPASSSSKFSNQHTAVPLNDKTESTHKMYLSTENRPAGVSTPDNLSEPKSEISKDTEPKSDTGVSSSPYATSRHGQTSGLREALALRPRREGSTSTGENKSSDGDREGKSQKDQSASGGEDGGSASGDKAMSNEHETGMNNHGTKAHRRR